MKTFLILFIVVLLVIYTAALCPFGCSCSDDSPCTYYCDNFQCQSEIPLWSRCSGHYFHPRECGTVSYCDASSLTCQLQKNSGVYCVYDYSCLSGYCDYTTNTCQYRTTPIYWTYYIVFPIVIGFIFFILVLVVIIKRRQRQRAMAFYQNPCVISPAGAPYSYQNPCTVGEMPPPSYQGSIYTPSPKPCYG